MLDRLERDAARSPSRAILSAVIFNALDHRRADPARAARRPLPRRLGRGDPAPQLLIYGLGGLIVPFVGIKLIDLVVGGLGIV